MRNVYIFLFILISLHADALGGLKHKLTFAEKDIFQSAYFLKNVPDLIPDYHGQPVRYFADHEGFFVFMTDEGLIYKIEAKDEKKAKEMEREREREHKKIKEDEGEGIPVRTSFASVRWIGANPHPRIEAMDKNIGYYTYLAGTRDADLHSIVTEGFSQVIYHDLYPGIDVVYSLPEKGGMKYDLIVQPGADLSQVQMEYGNDVKKIFVDKEGNIIIHTSAGDLVEHAPVSFTADSRSVAVSYLLKGNKISFTLPADFDHSGTLTIDPWVSPITQITGRNIGADVDFDVAGNVYVYGFGISSVSDVSIYQRLIKFDQSGNFVWIFLGSVPSINWSSTFSNFYNYVSNAKVDKIKNKIYVGKAFDAYMGTQTIRLTNAGLYDNFVTVANANFNETWSIISNCSEGTMLALGGGTSSNLNMGVIDTLSGVVTPNNITTYSGAFQDIVSGCYDAFGNLYVVMASNSLTTVNNHIFKINPTYNGNVWNVPTGYFTFYESNNIPEFVFNAANNFNSLAANGSYLYYYDAYNLKAFNLTTGAAVGTPFTLTTIGIPTKSGGIAVDECNNVYIGYNGLIKTFTFNGTTFTPGADIPLGAAHTLDTVLDVRYNPVNNLLYVSGTRLVGAYNAILSGSCNVVGTFTEVLVSDCRSTSITVTPSAGLVNPVFSYLWINDADSIIRQTTPGTVLHDTIVGLPPGHYSVQLQLNLNCGGAVHIDSFTVSDCADLIQAVDTTICLGQSALITANGTPPGGTYSWSPGGATTSSITVAPGVTTLYIVTYTPPAGSPLIDSIHVIVISGATVTVRDTDICSGQAATLFATPSVAGGTYLWSPGGAATQSISVSPAVTTPYIVTYTTAHCGIARDTALVSVRQSSATPLAQTICSGTHVVFKGNNISSSGTYRDTLTNAFGCDSIVTLTLTVLPPPVIPIRRSICIGSTYIFNGQPISASGIYTDTIQASGGCDSVLVLTLSADAVLRDSIARSVCSGSGTVFNGQLISAAGVYSDTVASVAGCDSITTLVLTVTSPVTVNLDRAICPGGSFIFHGQAIYAGGTYRDTLSNPPACDTIQVLTLTINPKPISAFSIQPLADTMALGVITVINASVNSDTILWLLNDMVIDLAHNDTLPIKDTGSYCVRLVASTIAGCTDTSQQCFYIVQNGFAMPNAFSPNGDGRNDLFYPVLIRPGSSAVTTFRIYNRWGQLMFDDPSTGWDGFFKKEPQPSGLYTYFVSVTLPGIGSPQQDKEVKKEGSFMLLR